MKLVFCGTPRFAVPTLEAVLTAGHTVALAVTQPDRAAGRGMQVQVGVVKVAALAHGIPVMQPEKIKHNEELRAELERIAPDAILVVAYGRIIPDWMLALPRFGCINLHGSLLPKYRGAAPIQWAVANGETVTGVTTMRLEAGLDTGPMLLAHAMPIAPEETAEDLFESLATVGAELMVRTLQGLEDGTVLPVEQDHALATLAPILTREDGRMDFATRTAEELVNRWRGFQPWPGAWTSLRGKKLTVHRMRVNGDPGAPGAPGVLRVDGMRIFVGCRESLLEFEEVQMEGKKRMTAAEFLRGFQVKTGERVGDLKGKGQNTGARNRPARPSDTGAPMKRPGAPIKRTGAAAKRVFSPAEPVAARSTVVVAPARQVAFALLLRIEAGKAHSDTALRAGAVEALSEQDRHLVTALVMGVLRWQIALDAVIVGLLQKPEEQLPAPVALGLRIGAFQLLHLDRIPAHAVLSDSVELVREAGAERATGLVNAVLRKIAASKDALRAKGLARPIVERTDAMAVRMGHPSWLVERWVKEYGRAAAGKVCEADQEEPGRGGLFTLPAHPAAEAEHPAVSGERVEAGASSDAGSADTGDAESRGDTSHPHSGRVEHRESVNAVRLPEIDDGSRLVAELAIAALPQIDGRAARVWDCCAARGVRRW